MEKINLTVAGLDTTPSGVTIVDPESYSAIAARMQEYHMKTLESGTKPKIRITKHRLYIQLHSSVVVHGRVST